MQPSIKPHHTCFQRRAVRFGALALMYGWSALFAAAQVIVYQERFETDGEGTRWVSEGRGVSEDPAGPVLR